MNVLAIYIIAICLVAFFYKGAVKTFKREPVVAALCAIFLAPIYAIWVIVEVFTAPVEKSD